MTGSTSSRAFRGLIWVGSSTGVVTVARLVNLIVLARLLTPADFGVMAVATVIIGLAHLVADAGLPAALVQRQTVSPADLKSALSLALFGAFCTSWLIASYAEQIENLTAMPGLGVLLFAMLPALVATALFGPTEAMLRRELAFRVLARIDVVSYMLGYFAVSILLAALGFGIWSLALAYVMERCMRCIQLLATGRARLELGICFTSARKLLHFGIGYTAAAVANLAATRGDKTAVTRVGDPSLVGEYDRAYQLMVLPANIMDKVVARVLFPALSSIQHDVAALKRNYLRGLNLTAMLMMPISVMSALLSNELVSIVLGSQWTGTASTFFYFAWAMMFRCSYKIGDELAQASGAVYRRAWRQGVYALAVIAGALAGAEWGISGAAIGVSIAIAGNFFLMSQLANSITNTSWTELAKAHRGAALIAITCFTLAAPIAMLARHYLMPNWVVVAASVGMATLGSAIVLFRYPAVVGDEGRWLLDLGRTAARSKLRRPSSR